MKRGTRRKLKKRGAAWVPVTQNARIVATTGATSVSAGGHVRRSGLAAKTIANSTTSVKEARLGRRKSSLRSEKAGTRV